MPTYLAKSGKTFGPFNPEEVAELKKSGEFFSYEWMWDGVTPDWARVPPVAPPPPVPALAPPKAAPQAAPPPVVRSDKRFHAVCHDFHRLMSGMATQVTTGGCELVSEDTSSPAAFAPGAKVWIDLLDEPSDKSVTMQVTIGAVKRSDKCWVYQIKWQNCPLL